MQSRTIYTDPQPQATQSVYVLVCRDDGEEVTIVRRKII
jgi:hypothetical protein